MYISLSTYMYVYVMYNVYDILYIVYRSGEACLEHLHGHSRGTTQLLDETFVLLFPLIVVSTSEIFSN